MECANPECRAPAADLSTGVLRLIELDVPPDQRVIRSDGGFPVCSVPSHYFWLCSACAAHLRIKQWTRDGLTFERRSGDLTGIDAPMASLRHGQSHFSIAVARKSA